MLNFQQYDENASTLHDTNFHNDRIDYWTGYWDNLPWLKSLITEAFDMLTISSTFDYLM